MQEHHFTCLYCWQTISVLVDLSIGQQTYIEDCEVCCKPFEVTVVSNGQSITAFEVQPAQ